jgi:thymidylate synthase (FAD)
MDIKVELLNSTPLEIAVKAIRQCYESQDKSDSVYGFIDTYKPKEYHGAVYLIGPKDKALVQAIIKSGHTSTLEHLTYNFHIKGISRLVLQELARHRMASLSVKSTRYTLKELMKEESFMDFGVPNPSYYFDTASKYINLTGIKEIDIASLHALESLRVLVKSEFYSNDYTKYALPECYKTDLFWTINARSLRNFFCLRDSVRAHFEIRELARKVWEQIPNDHRFLFEDCVQITEI